MVELEVTGTHQGPLVGPTVTIPPTNRRLNMLGAGLTLKTSL